MKVAILGGGNGAHALAADLSLGGISVSMWEHPNFLEKFRKTLESGSIEIEGAARVGTAKLDKVTTNIKEAIVGVDFILVAMPAYGQEEVARLCAPHVHDGQTIILIPGNGGSLVFMKVFKDLGVRKNLNLAETSTLPYATRLKGPAHVVVFNRARMVPIGVSPSKNSDIVFEKFRSIVPIAVKTRNIIEAALNNPNPIVHAAGCLLNVGRVEYSGGNFHFYKEGMTNAVGNLIVAMDEERMAISRALNVTIFRSDGEYEPFLNTSMNVMFGKGSPPRLDLAAAGRQRSPSSLQDRFIAEEVPFGLVFMVGLAKISEVNVPIIESVIRIFSIVNNTNYFKVGRNLENLGISDLSKEAFIRLIEEGNWHDQL